MRNFVISKKREEWKECGERKIGKEWEGGGGEKEREPITYHDQFPEIAFHVDILQDTKRVLRGRKRNAKMVYSAHKAEKQQQKKW